MESPVWPRTERLRPVVRRAGPTGSRETRLRVAAAGVAAFVVALGIVAVAMQPDASGKPGPVAPALAVVAPDVAGRPWLVRRGDDRWVWGRAGAAGRSVLPGDESGLAIAGHWLASGLSTADTTRVRVRDLDTGEVLVERQLDIRVATATFAGDRLLMTGYAGGLGAADGGIVALGIPTGDLRTLVPGGAFPGRLGATPAKGDFHLSGSGSIAAVNTCGSRGCDTVVIDVATLATSTPQLGGTGFLRAVTDDVLVLTDADGTWIKGLDGRTGKPRFTVRDAGLMEPVSMADGRVIADIGGGTRGWQVAALGSDGSLAAITEPTRAPGPWVWPAVSSPTVAVLGDARFEEALAGGANAPNLLIRGTDLRQVGTLVVQPGQ